MAIIRRLLLGIGPVSKIRQNVDQLEVFCSGLLAIAVRCWAMEGWWGFMLCP
jgi:hypothetical protein